MRKTQDFVTMTVDEEDTRLLFLKTVDEEDAILLFMMTVDEECAKLFFRKHSPASLVLSNSHQV